MRRNCGINVIIEGLVVNRQGLITESAEDKIQKDIKGFLSDHNISGPDKKKLYTLLDMLYLQCNNAGPYKLIQGGVSKMEGDMDDTDYYHPIVNPTLYELTYEIKFLAAVDIKSLYKSIYQEFNTIKSKFEVIYIDQFSISVDFVDDYSSGLFFIVEKLTKGFKIEIGYKTYIDEAATGLCGTEIGLPIDHENCESTGIGGVSTPTGGFTDDKKKKKLIPVIDAEEEGSKESEEEDSDKESSEKDGKSKKEDSDDIERLRCPKCKSPNVNSDGETLVCSDCSYTWSLSDEEDDNVRDNMLPQEDDVSVSDYQKSGDFYQNNNDVECIQTQQNVDRNS